MRLAIAKEHEAQFASAHVFPFSRIKTCRKTIEMTGKIFNIQSSGNLVEMEEAGFVTEDDFQHLLERYPDLLAGDQISSESPRRWLLITREMGIADRPSGSDRWSLDHLFIDQDGIPTLVEVKRSTDTRLRREVVGQVLDYAANAVVHWSLDKIQSEFERQCERDGVESESRLNAFIDEERSLDGDDFTNFWQRVKTNLQAGNGRPVVSVRANLEFDHDDCIADQQNVVGSFAHARDHVLETECGIRIRR